jgi:hypothetical protein
MLLLEDSETPPPPNTHVECGAALQRTLTISFDPVSIGLSTSERGLVIELYKKTWEYGFTVDGALELTFTGPSGLTCSVDGTGIDTTGTGPHWICKRPPSDDDQYFRFTFDLPAGAGMGLLPIPNKPAGGQPTMIIRVKRSCPTGVTKPTVDGEE